MQKKSMQEVVDVLLAEKMKQCQQAGIAFVPYVDGQWLGFMHPLDLCVIFGNALENAIEASLFLDRSQRRIDLKVSRIKDMIALRFFNSCLPEDSDCTISTKPDAHKHGYGLKNIRRAVEKYNGSMVIEKKEGHFILQLLIPLPSFQNSN